MTRTLRWVLVVLVGLSVGQELAPARSAGRPRTTALVCWAAGPEDDGAIGVIGGPVAKRGWLGGEQAKGLMHKRDELAVYGLESGLVGSAVLTNGGTLRSQDPDSPHSRGLDYEAKLDSAPGKERVQDQEPLIAAWHAPGTPKPRWVTAKLLNPKSRVYRQIIAEWLRLRGVAESAIGETTVEQLLRADVNRDGRDEVFISLHSFDEYIRFAWRDIRYQVASPRATRPLSYLLMRYLPRGSRRPRTVAIEGQSWDIHTILGFCDLDCDGWAETIAEQRAYESGGYRLYHWAGHGFRIIQGEDWLV